MQSISVTEFKAHCLELVNRVSKTGEPLMLTKRGIPTAVISPPPPEVKKKWEPGMFCDRFTIVGDIMQPIDEPWDAMS